MSAAHGAAALDDCVKDKIEVILISNWVGGHPALSVLLAADGSIHRYGPKHPDLFIGMTKEPLFAQLREQVDDRWLGRGGVYEAPDMSGGPCELSLSFRTFEGQEIGLKFVYGKESEGPPDDIVEFVRKAMAITDAWHDRQKTECESSTGPRPKRRWWQLW